MFAGFREVIESIPKTNVPRSDPGQFLCDSSFKVRQREPFIRVFFQYLAEYLTNPPRSRSPYIIGRLKGGIKRHIGLQKLSHRFEFAID